MHAKMLTGAFAALLLASCTSVDLLGAYRLGKQDYRSADPALWRAAVLHPTGADITDLFITLKDNADGSEAVRLAFVETNEAPSAELPKPGDAEVLALYRVDPDAVDEARGLQNAWLQEEGERERSLGVKISFKLTKPFERAWCEGEEKIISPVWVRIEPTARYRRILKPDALENVMKPAAAERCAAVKRGEGAPADAAPTESGEG